jgi:hypothetical protein
MGLWQGVVMDSLKLHSVVVVATLGEVALESGERGREGGDELQNI